MKIDWNKLGEERRLDKNRFYLIITGDKEFTSSKFVPVVIDDKVQMVEAQEVLNSFTDRLLRTRIANGNEIIVQCGDNNGVDAMAEVYARERDYKLNKYIADWDNNGSRAGYIRNEKLFSSVGLKENKGGIIFWDGEDSYTKNLIYLGWEFGISLRVFNYSDKRWLNKEQIENVQFEERREQLKYGRGY